MDLFFKFDPARISVDEMIALEENKMRGYRDLLARSLTDESGEYIPFEDAVKVIGKLSLQELEQAAKKFQSAGKDALPPGGGGR
jgi:hypothetical protein